MAVVLEEVRSKQAGITLVLDGHSLKIEDVASVARHRVEITLEGWSEADGEAFMAASRSGRSSSA